MITPEDLTRLYARKAYEVATDLYNLENNQGSLVEQNAEDFIAECDLAGIQSKADDSESA